jgi:hypothetical protein
VKLVLPEPGLTEPRVLLVLGLREPLAKLVLPEPGLTEPRVKQASRDPAAAQQAKLELPALAVPYSLLML